MNGKRDILPSHEALRIANDDAAPRYGDQTDLRVVISLQAGGWHVKFGPVEVTNGGGPHCVIDSTDGTIVSNRYFQ